MSRFNYDGINNVVRDASGQIEFNRRKNVEQDQKLSTLTSQVNELLSQAPAGFLPQVYYGLTRGNQTYRFGEIANYTIDDLPGNDGDAYEFLSDEETENYITAVGIQEGTNKISIIIRGDYNVNTDTFTIVNMRSGASLSVTLLNPLTQTAASYLGDYPAEDNKNKQITVLHDLQSNERNAVFASVDYSGDEIYNWVKIGKYTNGIDGRSIYTVSSSTEQAIFALLKPGDSFIVASAFTHGGVPFDVIGDVFLVNSINPLSFTKTGNIRGPQGEIGQTGATGQNGADGSTPYIQDNYWYIDGVSTGVIALGQDGTDGTDGQSFQMQSGLYSTPANYGEAGNVGPDSEVLQQLPTLPQSNITGKGYVVYDPLTTPLEPFYDLYYANNGDVSWTIIHPYSGINGQDGTDGYTPYIQNNQWYINGVSTGVQATGNTGPQGPTGLGWFISSAQITAQTTTVAANTVTVPTGYVLKVGDLILGSQYGFGRVTAISNDGTVLTISYIAQLQENVNINSKVDKTSTAKQIYGTDENGNQTTYFISQSANASSIPQRFSGGRMDCGAPTSANNCTNKDYVDTYSAKVDASNLSSANLNSWRSALGTDSTLVFEKTWDEEGVLYFQNLLIPVAAFQVEANTVYDIILTTRNTATGSEAIKLEFSRGYSTPLPSRFYTQRLDISSTTMAAAEETSASYISLGNITQNETLIKGTLVFLDNKSCLYQFITNGIQQHIEVYQCFGGYYDSITQSFSLDFRFVSPADSTHAFAPGSNIKIYKRAKA